VKEALSNLVISEQLGAETLSELENQARVIDNIENTLENIHGQMDKAERLLRGIDSLPAYIGNSLNKKKDKVRPKITEDRTVEVMKRVTPPMEIEILCKNVDCSFRLSLLSLSEDGFQCLDIETRQLIHPSFSYLYKDIQEIALRTRSEHMDIRFLHKDRFRLMSSYNQIIVNEIYYRTKGKIKVVFEPGAPVFEYGIERISTDPPVIRKEVEKGFVFRGNNPGFKLASLISDTPDNQETRSQLEEVDTHLTQISAILGRVYDMSLVTGQEIDRQNEQLGERITKKTDHAQNRIQGGNQKINHIIHNE
jgi:hypothetical protein